MSMSVGWFSPLPSRRCPLDFDSFDGHRVDERDAKMSGLTSLVQLVVLMHMASAVV
jgi:hypothetical protein